MDSRAAPREPGRIWRLALPIAAYLALVALFWPQINDDAFITFRYSSFLAEGHGPYFNEGEHVEGYTNFLLMLLLSGAIALGASDPWTLLTISKLINVAGGAAAVWAAGALADRWSRAIGGAGSSPAWVGLFAGLLAATNTAFVLNSTTGLETALYCGLMTLAFLLMQLAAESGRWRAAGAAFALAALTRPEGAAIFAVTLAGRLVAGAWRPGVARKHLILDASIVVACVAGQFAFRLAAYDGEWAPNTYHAKVGGMSEVRSAANYDYEFVRLHLGGPLALLALLPFAAPRRAPITRGARSTTPQRSLLPDVLPAALVVLFAFAQIFKTGPDWMPGFRMLVPVVPIWSALAASGVVALLSAIGRTGWTAGILSLVTAVVALWQIPITLHYHHHVLTRARGYREGHLALAEWLRANAKPGEIVALMDIGIIGYLNPRLRILDITGLTDRHIAKSPGGFLNKRFDPAYVFDQKPQYLVIVYQGPRSVGSLPDLNAFLSALDFWTPIEQELTNRREFVAHYARIRPVDPQTPPLERAACAIGAARVFEHAYPDGSLYLLALYTYHAE